MSIDLMLEVLDHAPSNLTSGERLTLVVIAERANETTRVARQSSRWDLDTLAHRVGVQRAGLRSIFLGLAKKGCEVRVELRKDKSGKPVFAFEGTAMSFKVPKLAKRSGHSITSDRERGCQDSTSDAQEVMPQHPRGDAVASERCGHSITQSLSTSLKDPSNFSLSDDVRPSVPAPRGPDEDREREDGNDFQEQEAPDPRLALVIKNGCPEHQARDVIEFIEGSNPNIGGLGWWFHADNNGSLAAQVARALDLLARCLRCNGTGRRLAETQYGTVDVACECAGPAVATLDRQPRTADRQQVNLPAGQRTASWERRRQQHQPYQNPDPAEYGEWLANQPPGRESAQARKFREYNEMAARLDAQAASRYHDPL